MSSEITALNLEQVHSIKCAICWDEFDVKENVIVRLPCTHVYCYNCFESLHQTRCPLCRATFARKTYLGEFMTHFVHMRNLEAIITSSIEELQQGQTIFEDSPPPLPIRRARRTRRTRSVNERRRRRNQQEEVIHLT